MRGMMLFAVALFAAMGTMAIFQESLHPGPVEEAPEPPAQQIETPKKNIFVGSCPTLEEDALEFTSKIPGASLVVFGSTSEALGAVRAGIIDVAVVGRVASPHELPAGTEEVRLKEGYTLVSKNKGSIEYSDLCSIEVCTHLPREDAEGMLPPCARINYHPNMESALGCMDSAVLIDWKEYSHGQELLIPVENGEKVKEFRTMVAYFPPIIKDSIFDSPE